jgi:hypothetical protein
VTRIEGYGIAVDLPDGWEGQISVRSDAEGPVKPVLHAATFTLPPGRGDFGGGAVERMSDYDAFIALCEYDAESAGTPLFATTSLGPLPPDEFHTQALQRPLPPQCGTQQFATLAGRAFCLYVVLGNHRLRGQLAPAAEAVVTSIEVSPA